MTRTKKWILFAVFLMGMGLTFGLVQYFEPARDHGNQPVQMTLSAEELFELFTPGEEEAQAPIGEVVLVRGTVKSVGNSVLVIQPGISCSMAAGWSSSQYSAGDAVEVKGRLIGFDALFGEVQMDFVSLMP